MRGCVFITTCVNALYTYKYCSTHIYDDLFTDFRFLCCSSLYEGFFRTMPEMCVSSSLHYLCQLHQTSKHLIFIISSNKNFFFVINSVTLRTFFLFKVIEPERANQRRRKKWIHDARWLFMN